MTSETTLNAATLGQYSQSNQQQANKLAQDFDDFLVLLTTQLQNQDPLSPMESTEFTNQLVQFSQVEQQINMNSKLNQMLSLQLAGTANVALGYVGLDVSYVGDLFYHKDAQVHEMHYSLAEDSVGTTIYIRDAETGDVVRTMQGESTAGNHKIDWDGLDDDGAPVAAGNYRITVDALDANDDNIDTSTLVTGRVTGIESVNGVIQLLLEGEGIVPVSSIINAKEPSTNEPEETADNTDTTDTEEVPDEETT